MVSGRAVRDGTARADFVDYCVALGIAPVVTYNHFTAPHWFARRGGWLDSRAPAVFARYCDLVTERLGDGMKTATAPAQTGGSCTLTTAERPPWTTASASFSTPGSSPGSETVTPYAPPAARATPGRSASGSKLT